MLEYVLVLLPQLRREFNENEVLWMMLDGLQPRTGGFLVYETEEGPAACGAGERRSYRVAKGATEGSCYQPKANVICFCYEQAV
jgi:hypothetical protein